MSIPTDGEFSSSARGRVEPDNPAAEIGGKATAPLRLTTLQNAVLAAGVALVVAVWIAAGWAFIGSFREPPTPKSAPSGMEKSAPSAAESPRSAAEPTALAAAATDNPPKPPKPQPLPRSESLPTSQAATSALARAPEAVDDELVDPTTRDLIMRGWALYHLPYTPVRWQEARHDFEQALKADPRSNEARIGLASILATKLADGWSPVLQEDIPRAERLLLETIDNGSVSNRATAHFTLGVLRQLQDRLADAQAEFETAISLDHNNPRAYLHLGETLLYLGQPEAGIPPLEQAIRLNPADPNIAIAYWALGTCQLLLGRADQAIELLQTARAANDRWWVTYLYLAGAYGLRSDLDKARAAIAESLTLKPALTSLARMRIANPHWLGNQQYWALQEKTLNVGLRRAGFPDQ
jgi:Tfp pilus assembly protein PilF